jgi:hypothetical protein
VCVRASVVGPEERDHAPAGLARTDYTPVPRPTAGRAVLEHLGLEPLLDLRLRVGEGVGASLAVALLISGLELCWGIGRTAP